MISVIINPIAGRLIADAGRKRAAAAAQVLESCGEPGEILVTERRGHARELAAAAVAAGARLIIAWGGDGTVNEAASALVSTETALGIVPSGSGNGLARELGISSRPERALTEAIAARPRSMDAGELGGRLFFSIAGVGFDAHIATCFDREKAGRRGFSSYARMTIGELMGYRCENYRVETGGRSAAHHAMLVTFANSGQWGNGARIAPDARIDDGRLDLVVFEETSRLTTFVCALPRLFNGTVTRLKGVSTRQVERALIESDSPMLFHVDGEPVQGGTRLEGRVHPGVLRIAVR